MTDTELPQPPKTNPYLEVQAPTHLRMSKIVAYALNIWVTIGIVLLGLRVFLLAFSANALTPFVDFVYRTSADYLAPFRGIFPPKSLGETGYFDVAAVFAIVIYLMIAWGIGALIVYIQSKIDESEYEQKLVIARAEADAKDKALTDALKQR